MSTQKTQNDLPVLHSRDKRGITCSFNKAEALKTPRNFTKKTGSEKFGSGANSSSRVSRPRFDNTEANNTVSGGWSPTEINTRPEFAKRPIRAPRTSTTERADWSKPEIADYASQDKDAFSQKDAWKLKSPRKKFRVAAKTPRYGTHETENGDGLNLLYGIHSVSAALRNPRRKFIRLLATENGALRLAEDGSLPLEATIVTPDVISKLLTPDAVHQGVLLEVEPLAPLPLAHIPADAIVLALDQVTDPHNVGAILRSCAAFNVAALIITDRHSPEVTGVLAKAASGALEHVPFATVRNLSDALEKLKSRGFMCVGLDSEAPTAISQAHMQKPVVIVMGAEGKGLRQKTRDTCTDLVRLDMPGAIKSLNVSNAAAIALYAVTTGLKTASRILL